MAFRLPRLDRNAKLVNPDGTPSLAFQRWWQSTVDAIEGQEGGQDSLIADLAAAIARIEANEAATDAVTLANDISASWITPGAVLTATDAGTDATITVADFTRVYDIAPAVAITGGALTGLAYSTQYAVYYDDTTQANATPTFVATTATSTARHNYIAGRHYVDTITTPASGGGGTSGGGYTAPGGGTVNDGYVTP